MTSKPFNLVYLVILLAGMLYPLGIQAEPEPSINIEGDINIIISPSPNPVTPQPPIETILFSCVAYGKNQWSTVAQKTGGSVFPLIIWTQEGSRYFGENYPPRTRCEIVSERMNIAVKKNGGSLKNMLLTHGRLNGETVICVLNVNDRGCYSDNLLFTLKPENASKVKDILGQLIRTSYYGSSAGVIYETSSQVYVSLEVWEQQNLEHSANFPQPNTPNQPQPPPKPNGEDWSL